MPTAEKLDLAHLALSVAIVGTARDLLAAAREWLTEAGTVRVPVVAWPACCPTGRHAGLCVQRLREDRDGAPSRLDSGWA